MEVELIIFGSEHPGYIRFPQLQKASVEPDLHFSSIDINEYFSKSYACAL